MMQGFNPKCSFGKVFPNAIRSKAFVNVQETHAQDLLKRLLSRQERATEPMNKRRLEVRINRVRATLLALKLSEQ